MMTDLNITSCDFSYLQGKKKNTLSIVNYGVFKTSHAHFIFGNIETYLHFLLFRITDKVKPFEILPSENKEPFILSSHNDGYWCPGSLHQQPYYWPSYPGIFQFSTKGLSQYKNVVLPV